MRKALCVGIDSYQNIDDLHGCVNDANAVKAALERNGDGTLNFDVKIMCSTSENSYINRGELRDAVEELFKSDSEIAVFIFQDMDLLIVLEGIYVPVRSIDQMMDFR